MRSINLSDVVKTGIYYLPVIFPVAFKTARLLSDTSLKVANFVSNWAFAPGISAPPPPVVFTKKPTYLEPSPLPERRIDDPFIPGELRLKLTNDRLLSSPLSPSYIQLQKFIKQIAEIVLAEKLKVQQLLPSVKSHIFQNLALLSDLFSDVFLDLLRHMSAKELVLKLFSVIHEETVAHANALRHDDYLKQWKAIENAHKYPHLLSNVELLANIRKIGLQCILQKSEQLAYAKAKREGKTDKEALGIARSTKIAENNISSEECYQVYLDEIRLKHVKFEALGQHSQNIAHLEPIQREYGIDSRINIFANEISGRLLALFPQLTGLLREDILFPFFQRYVKPEALNLMRESSIKATDDFLKEALRAIILQQFKDLVEPIALTQELVTRLPLIQNALLKAFFLAIIQADPQIFDELLALYTSASTTEDKGHLRGNIGSLLFKKADLFLPGMFNNPDTVHFKRCETILDELLLESQKELWVFRKSLEAIPTSTKSSWLKPFAEKGTNLDPFVKLFGDLIAKGIEEDAKRSIRNKIIEEIIKLVPTYLIHLKSCLPEDAENERTMLFENLKPLVKEFEDRLNQAKIKDNLKIQDDLMALFKDIPEKVHSHINWGEKVTKIGLVVAEIVSPWNLSDSGIKEKVLGFIAKPIDWEGIKQTFIGYIAKLIGPSLNEALAPYVGNPDQLAETICQQMRELFMKESEARIDSKLVFDYFLAVPPVLEKNNLHKTFFDEMQLLSKIAYALAFQFPESKVGKGMGSSVLQQRIVGLLGEDYHTIYQFLDRSCQVITGDKFTNFIRLEKMVNLILKELEAAKTRVDLDFAKQNANPLTPSPASQLPLTPHQREPVVTKELEAAQNRVDLNPPPSPASHLSLAPPPRES